MNGFVPAGQSMIKDLACHIFVGFKDKRGYGFKYDKRIKKMKLAHRLVYELKHDCFLKKNEVIMHLCDTPSCVNPQHLRLGSQAENLKDCRDKKRHMYGDRHTKSKISLKKALLIRKIYQSGALNQSEIGILVDLNQSTVRQILMGETWKETP